MLIAFVLVREWGSWSRLVPTLILCIAYGLWILVMRTLPFAWRDRPAAITAFVESSLPDALASVARGWSARTGVSATVTTSGTARPLTTETEVALLRTAHEALANVERHAAAARVTLKLQMDAARIRLEVRDDGRGFDLVDRLQRQSDEVGGYGLIAMRERLASAAGDLVVESRPGHGTVVRAEVPA
jgi:signal transduction histidine kinase